MAGGGGTRLWPLSRPEMPKPFLPLIGDQTLIQRTVARLAPLISPRDVYVVAERRHLHLAEQQLPQVPLGNLLGEPMGRNTAAAVALSAEAIDRPDGEVMVVLPADAWITDEAGFRDALSAAAIEAGEGKLVTLGVQPDRPETGYGYILARPPARKSGGSTAFDVDRFVEKPGAEKAAELISTGLASWNAGIFIWQRATIRERLARHAPDILGPIRAACEAGSSGPGGLSSRDAELDAIYPSIRATSIDYAVMEPASVEGAVAVIPMDVGWSDLGSWAALRDALQAGASGTSVGHGNRRDIGSQDSLVLAGDRLVVTIGLRDVIVVDTPEALLVCAADRSQDVRTIVQELGAAAAAAGPAAATADPTAPAGSAAPAGASSEPGAAAPARTEKP